MGKYVDIDRVQTVVVITIDDDESVVVGLNANGEHVGMGDWKM